MLRLTIGSVTLLRFYANIHISHEYLIVVQVISLSRVTEREKESINKKETHLCARRKKNVQKKVRPRFIAVAKGKKVSGVQNGYEKELKREKKYAKIHIENENYHKQNHVTCYMAGCNNPASEIFPRMQSPTFEILTSIFSFVSLRKELKVKKKKQTQADFE